MSSARITTRFGFFADAPTNAAEAATPIDRKKSLLSTMDQLPNHYTDNPYRAATVTERSQQPCTFAASYHVPSCTSFSPSSPWPYLSPAAPPKPTSSSPPTA